MFVMECAKLKNGTFHHILLVDFVYVYFTWASTSRIYYNTLHTLRGVYACRDILLILYTPHSNTADMSVSNPAELSVWWPVSVQIAAELHEQGQNCCVLFSVSLFAF